MRAVCDTCSLINLRKGGVVDCLGQIFESVLIPLAVKDECKDSETQALLQKNFFEIIPVSSVLPLSGIQKGELEAISLAIEQNISIFISDDEKALKKASQQGLIAIRSVRVQYRAEQFLLKMNSIKFGTNDHQKGMPVNHVER